MVEFWCRMLFDKCIPSVVDLVGLDEWWGYSAHTLPLAKISPTKSLVTGRETPPSLGFHGRVKTIPAGNVRVTVTVLNVMIMVLRCK
jgi:hypothetical protein